MKITLIHVLLTSATIVLANATDTNGQEVLDKKVSIKAENAHVRDVLAQLEEKADVRFTYRSSLLKNMRNVSIEEIQVSVRNILEHLFQGQVKYEVVGKQIVLKGSSEFEGEDNLSAVNQAPAITVTGQVKDETGAPLPGVNILEKGTVNGTTTDVSGNYSLSVDENAILVFSFIGYASLEVPVNGQTVINTTLQLDIKSLEEVVVVGYGEQKKVTVTGSVVAVGGAELEQSPAVDISNAFAGRLAGVVAVQTSGEPGYDQATIRIRGVNTMGNVNPLVVIDGIPDREGGFGRLSPQEIESISVLKDASAAIYGSRAANGVILVTTKRGKVGAPKITYDFNQGWAQPTRIPKMSSAVEYATIMNELQIFGSGIPVGEWDDAWQAFEQGSTSYTSPANGNSVSPKFTSEEIRQHGEGTDPWRYPDTDWFGDALKTWSPQSRHNLQLSGGSENVKYFTSLGYVHQDAYYKNSATFYKQYNARINLDAKISDYVSTSFGFLAREESRNFPTQSAGSIFRMLMRGRPTEPEVWPNGLPGPDIENGQNPYVITTSATGYHKNPTTYLQSNGKIDITNPWVKGLRLTFQGSLDRTIDRIKRWETPWYLYTWDKTTYEADGVTPQLQRALRSTFTDARLTQSVGSRLNHSLTTMLAYDNTFSGNHTIGLLAGVTKEEFEADFIEARRREYISTSIDQPFFGGSVTEVLGGNDNRNTYNRARLGYYGRVNYNYREKYIAEFLWRVDASSFFPEGNRFGFFPSISAGWVLSSEELIRNSLQFLSYLKLRASYGQMGNDQIYRPDDDDNPKHLVEYAFLSLYDPGRYPINGQVVTTLLEGTVPNPNFTWEVSNNFNVGLEGTILNDRLDFSFEYFYNKRSQMLIFKQGSTPATSGIGNRLPPVNEGRMDNRGFEFTLGYNGEISGLTYSFGVNAGYNKNQIVYMDEAEGAPDYQRQTGYPFEAFLAYEYDGVFQSEEEIDEATREKYSGVTQNLRPGDMKFKDINSDGVINGQDKKRLDKSRVPNFNYGVTLRAGYRNFDLSILFQGASGALLQLGTESGDIGNFLKHHFDNRWSIENPSSEHPRLADRNNTYYQSGEFAINTYNLVSKNYLRLKNAELGYTLPVSLSKKVALSYLRIYVNGFNLITWDKYKIFDPESDNNSLQYYPQSRVINTGVRLTF